MLHNCSSCVNIELIHLFYHYFVCIVNETYISKTPLNWSVLLALCVSEYSHKGKAQYGLKCNETYSPDTKKCWDLGLLPHEWCILTRFCPTSLQPLFWHPLPGIINYSLIRVPDEMPLCYDTGHFHCDCMSMDPSQFIQKSGLLGLFVYWIWEEWMGNGGARGAVAAIDWSERPSHGHLCRKSFAKV